MIRPEALIALMSVSLQPFTFCLVFDIEQAKVPVESFATKQQLRLDLTRRRTRDRAHNAARTKYRHERKEASPKIQFFLSGEHGCGH